MSDDMKWELEQAKKDRMESTESMTDHSLPPLTHEDLDLFERWNKDKPTAQRAEIRVEEVLLLIQQSRMVYDLAAQVAQARRGVALAKAYHHFEQMFADGSRAEWVAARKALDATYASYVKHLARHPGGRAVGGV